MSDDYPEEAIADGLPVVTAEEAAGHIGQEAIVLASGFGGVGYPKRVPEKPAIDDRDRSLTVFSGGGVGGEIDETLIETDQLARRYPFQTRETSHETVIHSRIGQGQVGCGRTLSDRRAILLTGRRRGPRSNSPVRRPHPGDVTFVSAIPSTSSAHAWSGWMARISIATTAVPTAGGHKQPTVEVRTADGLAEALL